ncbi:MAG: PrsW family intramembrane metalloprotease [Bacilli bacterium]|nr:PrsW family intramembrane metalloprotease [Bacilli bacterium]
MSKLLLIFSAVMPIFVICFFVYRKDDEKEPFLLLIKLFICGIMSVFLVYFFTYILQYFFSFFRFMPFSKNYFKLFIYIFILIAAVEEISKFIMAYLFGYGDINFDQPYDIIVYTVFVSLGFACFENILYVMRNGLDNALLRAVTAVPIHACYGIFMGYYLSLAKIARKNGAKGIHRRNIILSILVPILLHTLYDYLIFLNDPFCSLVLMVTIVIMYYFAFLRLIQMSNVQVRHF